MGTVSGTGLATWDSQPNYLFDANNANAFSAESVGHVIVITSGSPFTAAAYLIQAYYPGTNMGGQGTNNAIYVSRAPGSAPSTGSRSGVWSYTTGSKSWPQTSGTMLTHYGSGLYYDPDSPIPANSIGRQITISGGTGFTAGTYTITDEYLTGFDNGVLHYLNNNSDNAVPSSTSGNLGSVRGASWSFASGGVLPPSLIPDTNRTTAVKLLAIGDSITYGNSNLGTVLAAKFPNASTTLTNSAVSGSTTTMWLPGNASGYLADAIAAANSAGSTIATICLGANDSSAPVSGATYLANMQTIVKALYASIPTLTRVVLQGTLYTADPTRNTTSLREYRSLLRRVGHGSQLGSLTEYSLFAASPRLLSDTVHPGNGGALLLARIWVDGVAAALNSESGLTIDDKLDAIQAKTDNLPASPAAVGSAMTLASGSITAAVVADGAIDAGALASGTITADKIASDALTAAKIATGAIDADALAADAVAEIAAAINLVPFAVESIHAVISQSESTNYIKAIAGDDKYVIVFFEDEANRPISTPAGATAAMLSAAGSAVGTATISDSKTAVGYYLIRLQVPSSGSLPATLRITFAGGSGGAYKHDIPVRCWS